MPTKNGSKGKASPSDAELMKLLRRLPGQLVGTAEAARILDVERSRIGRWRKAGRMPEPIEELDATPVWLRPQVEELREEREAGRRRRGRSVEVLAQQEKD